MNNETGVLTEPISMAEIKNLAKKAISDKLFPGCAIAVIENGKINFCMFGKQTYEEKSPKIETESMYDIASITKPMLATIILNLVSSGKLNLDQEIKKIIEISGSCSKMITIRNLLTNTVDFNITDDLKKYNPYSIMSAIKTKGLSDVPGTSFAYHNTTAILLGHVLETFLKKTGRLDEVFRDNLFHPLGMFKTTFNPTKNEGDLKQIVPTEKISANSPKLLHGIVHDEIARIFNPVPVGCAGVFSTIEDMAKFAEFILSRCQRKGKLPMPEINADIFEQMCINQVEHIPGHYFGFGWDKFAPGYSSCSCFNKRAIVMTGFTGCSIMLDPEKSFGVVILSNAIHPNRNPGSMKQFRKDILESVLTCKHCGVNVA